MNVILIHGMFCNSTCWQLVDEKLSEQGISSIKPALHPAGEKLGRDFNTVVQTVSEQLQDLQGQPSLLVGHSLGALVVEKLLPLFPQAEPMFVDPTPDWGNLGPLYPLWVAARRGRFWKKLVQLDNFEIRKLLCQAMSDEEFKIAPQWIEAESGELLRQAFWFFDLFGAATRIHRYSSKALSILTGANDPIGTENYCRSLISQYGPDSKLDIVDNVGHMSILQPAGASAIANAISRLYTPD